LLTTPLGKLELLHGYAVAFGLLATAQAVVASALTLGPLGLHVDGMYHLTRNPGAPAALWCDTAIVLAFAAAALLLGASTLRRRTP
jgi:hypothetical protein